MRALGDSWGFLLPLLHDHVNCPPAPPVGESVSQGQLPSLAESTEPPPAQENQPLKATVAEGEGL